MKWNTSSALIRENLETLEQNRLWSEKSPGLCWPLNPFWRKWMMWRQWSLMKRIRHRRIGCASVAQKIFEIARTRQVICITHSPQIASFADSHFVIFKERSKGRTYTRVKRLSQEERIRELARMLGGSANWETAVEHAKELLHFASRQKS